MNIITNLLKSSLGKKFIMAVTGMALFLFVVMHLLGNLQFFLGPEALNRYGHFLQSNPEIIWPARIGLLLMVALHIWSAIKLSAENKAARPVGYTDAPTPVAASYASRTMMMSGLIVAAFIIYHLLHFTAQVQAVNLTGKDFLSLQDGKGRHDVFGMMVTGFRQPLVSGFYILAMALLCLHLSHGVSAMFQSVGWKNETYSPLIDRFAKAAALVILIGYISIPIAVLSGMVSDSRVTHPTKAGTYSSGNWKYVYSIEAQGTRAERRVGQLLYNGGEVSGKPGNVLKTPLGKFLYFGPDGYSAGWLKTLTYDKPVFDKDGNVSPSVVTNSAWGGTVSEIAPPEER